VLLSREESRGVNTIIRNCTRENNIKERQEKEKKEQKRK
jgi:hypothetical protein